jgi:hypothetical protein
MRLVDAPCGGGWGLGVEGVPDGMRVTLYADDKVVGELKTGEPRGDGKPFKSRAGKRALEIIFAPSGKYEYSLVFKGTKSTKRDVVFPIRITVFRDAAKGGSAKTMKKNVSPAGKKKG